MKSLNLCISLVAASVVLCSTSPCPAAGVAGSTGLVVLNGTQSGALLLSGSARAIVPCVRVNSMHSQSITGSGNITLDSPDVATVGRVRFTGNACCTSSITCNAGNTSDPLTSLATPSTTGMPDRGSRSITTDTNLHPGFYSGGIRVSSHATVALGAGLYILDGNGLDVSGGASVQAEGVTLYFRGRSTLTLSGQSSMHMTPPLSGAYTGISVFTARGNDSRVSLSGGSGIDVSGTLYLPAAHLTISGNAQASAQGPMVGSFVIADSIDISGTGKIIIGGGSPVPTMGMLFD